MSSFICQVYNEDMQYVFPKCYFIKWECNADLHLIILVKTLPYIHCLNF